MKPALPNSLLSPFIDFLNDDVFNGPFFRSEPMPAVNVREDADQFQLEVVAPGMSKQDFKLTIENGQLIISAARKTEFEEKKDTYRRKEYNFSSFSRSFTLPENINPEDTKADYQDGVLRIDLKKKVIEPKQAAKEIPVA